MTHSKRTALNTSAGIIIPPDGQSPRLNAGDEMRKRLRTVRTGFRLSHFYGITPFYPRLSCVAGLNLRTTSGMSGVDRYVHHREIPPVWKSEFLDGACSHHVRRQIACPYNCDPRWIFIWRQSDTHMHRTPGCQRFNSGC